jgi:hypothetical protein
MQSSVLVFEDNFYIQPGTGCWPGTRSDANKPHAAYCLQSAATSLDLQLADGANFAYMYADHDSTISGPGGGRKRRGDRR